MKHTKGIWITEKFHNGYHIYSLGKKICSIWNSLFTDHEAQSNAKLIAAAPELLKACQKAMESEIDGSYVVATKWWGEMKQAIKKATS